MNYKLNNKLSIISIAVNVLIIGLIIGLYFSNALKSISLVSLAVCSLFYITDKNKLQTFLKKPLFITTAILIIVYSVSALFSNNHAEAWQSVQIKLLYVFVLFTFYATCFSKKESTFYIAITSICAIIQTLYATFYFIEQYANIEHLYAIGNVLPVIKIHHIQIAVLIAITIVLLVNYYLIYKKKKAIFIAIWLFIFLHIFAVRSGLVLVYFMLLLYASVYLLKLKKWKNIVVLYSVLITTLVIAINYSSTLKTKINYTIHDINQFKNNNEKAYEYSDSRRLAAIKNGIILLKQHPYLGTGLGDITTEISKLYQQQNPTLDKKYYYLPHNQFIYFYSVFGYILGSIVSICFIFPVFYLFKKKNYLFATIYAALLLFSCWDAFLGTLFGNCLYLMVIGFSLKNNS